MTRTGTADQLRWELDDADRRQGELLGPVERHVGGGEYRGMEFLHVRAKTIINHLPADHPLPFRHTVNVYRGCSHACTYCFARPTHEYLGLGAGEDFERKLVVKVNAVDLLRAELAPKRWAGEPIAMGTNTDPYQRCEGKYHLTRGVIEVLSEAANPFSILTKSTLVLRDLDLLARSARRTTVSLALSVGTLDDDVWRLTEPGTPRPARRLRAVEALNEAGVDCSVLVAPVIPGLSDEPDQIDAVVAAAVAAGATSVSAVVLHLRPGVKEHFLPWLERARPDLADRYRRWYRGSSAPAAERARIAAMVDDALTRHGGRRRPEVTDTGHPPRRFGAADDRAGTPVADPSPPTSQLSLGL